MNDLSFRRAVSGDIHGIVEMLADDELGREREDPSFPLDANYVEAFAAIDSDPNQLLAVAESEGRLVGCLQLTFIPGISRLGMWRGQVESIRIATDKRGRGFGRKMFEWAIAECRKRGCRLVQLTTDKKRADTERFYRSLGFRASHEGMKLAL